MNAKPPVGIIVSSAAAEAFLLTRTIPQYLPPNPLTITIAAALVVNFLVWFLYMTLVYPFFLSPVRHLPGPSWWIPWIASGPSQLQRPPGKDYLKWMTEIPNDGLITFTSFFNEKTLMVTSPKAIGELLVTKSYDFEKPVELRDFLRKILGDGLIIVEGDIHKFQRKHIMPVFQFRHIKDLYPMMLEKADKMCLLVEEDAKAHPNSASKSAGNVEINHWANKVTMDIIGIAGLGREFNALRNSDDELIQYYEEILEPTYEKVLFFVVNLALPEWLVLRLPWKLNQRLDFLTKGLTRVCNELVASKKASIKRGGDQSLDILSVLIRSNNFSDKELADQMLTFLAAGHETTSSAFTWSTYLLAKHPEIQKRLRDELNEHMPADPANFAELGTLLESLPLLNAVINETLRLYPTVPITIRVANRDTSLLGVECKKGQQVLVAPWAVNHNPHLWGERADDFVPDRWINASDGKPNKTGGAESAYALLTFLHGPRSCIGSNFAKAEMRCLIASFVRKFNVELVNPHVVAVPGGVITSKPQDGMDLKLTLLEQAT